MFRVPAKDTGGIYRMAVTGLLLMSAAALAVTIWVMTDFLREQEIVHGLINQLPPESALEAAELEGELRWQFRLTILVVLNVVVTGIAIALLSRAYRSSQASLRDMSALAGDILGSVDQAVITTDLRGNVTSINRRGMQLLPAALDSIGEHLSELSHTFPLEAFRDDWMIEKSDSMTRDYHVRLAGGHRILRASCQTLGNADDEQIGYVLQVHDVTERVLIEDRMRRMERYMGLGSLAVGLHHEIKNPLAALSLHVQLLEEQLGDTTTSGEVRSMLDVIKSEVSRIGGVLESFRDFASTGRLNLAPVSPRKVIQRLVELISPQAQGESIVIDSRMSDDLPESIPADRVRLEQVLLNLMVNALEAMSGGGKMTIAVCDDDDFVVIKISDTGHGVPDDLRNKIFDPYFTTKSSGTGLGLALCDKIMREHNGSLEFESSPRGTTFQLMLPKTAIPETDGPE